jgi:hypothetical protein
VVEGLNIPPEETGVTWTVTGASNSTGTSISGGGLLRAAADETGPLTVRAASVYDITQSATVETAVNALTVRFLADGAVVETAAVGVGGTVPLPALPSKEGFVGKGWYTTPSGGGAKFSVSTLPITTDTDIHVRWLAYTDTKISNASGGNEIKYVSTPSGFDEVHIFKTNGNFTLPVGVTGAQVLVVAGGGAGGDARYDQDGGENWDYGAGGGGAGGVQYASSIAIAPATYAVVVGSGGTPATDRGGDSKFGEVTAMGGGKGGVGGEGFFSSYYNGSYGGSGGGGGTPYSWPTGGSAEATEYEGYTKKGNRGGNSNGWTVGAGGGGAGGMGGITSIKAGGEGFFCEIDGTSYDYARGGWGSIGTPVSTYQPHYGEGGDGGLKLHQGTNGQPGIVIVRFPYKYADF